MSHAKVISTTFGVTVAVVSSGSTAKKVEKYNMDNKVPFSGKRVELPSKYHLTARDLFNAIHSTQDFNKDMLIYKQDKDGNKIPISAESLVVPESLLYPNIIYFKNNNTSVLRLGALISGGPDGIVAASLMKEAGGTSIKGYDFFYIKAGRPSDWQEYASIERFLYEHFNPDITNLHVIDISRQKKRMVACGDDEVTYHRFGLSAALSLVAAECEQMKDKKPDVILFGIHGADALFKARKSKEYTRRFILSWNKFWKSFYSSSPAFIAPFIDVFDKIDILKMAKPLGVNLGNTWSCYLGGQTHCGECKSCLERRLAYKISDLHDPTVYNSKISQIKSLKHKLGYVSFEKQHQWYKRHVS